MKRLILTIFALFAVVGASVATLQPAYAVDLIDPACQGADPNNLPPACRQPQETDNPLLGPDGVLTNAVKILSLIVGIAAVIVIIIAGLTFVTSAGDPQKAVSSRQAIIYALIGVGVAAVAQAIVTFILSKVGT